MLVSFCVIAYNEEKALDSLFKDIIAQDYPHEKMEIVLVNAMSTDQTRKKMEEFSKEDHGFRRVVVLDNKKKIQAAGWNVAITAAKGDVILRIDAHTMIPSDFVSKNIQCIISGENVTGGRRPNVVEDETPWKHTLLLAESSMFGSSIAPYRKGNHKTYVKSVFHGAYRKEVFEKAGLFNENLGRTEDNEMHYRIRKAGYKICFNPDIISYQNIRNSWCGMLKQKYGNGHWIGLTLGVCPGCFSIHHFVPLAFVLALILTGIIVLLGNTGMFVCLCVLYVIVDLLMSVLAVQRQKWYNYYLMLPLIFLSLHLAYGVGTLIGIIEMPFWVRKIKRDKNE